MGYHKPKLLEVHDKAGDLFKRTKAGDVIVHACNCIGVWGSGFAAHLKRLYPNAYKQYKAHCKKWRYSKRLLLGSALLISPVETKRTGGSARPRRNYIGCLFTSYRGGAQSGSSSKRRRDAILRATESAMGRLLMLVGQARKNTQLGVPVGKLKMPRINSGVFGVDWWRTKKVLRKVTVKHGMPKFVLAYELKKHGRGRRRSWSLGW